MNTATIIGRAGQDAEIRYFESGKVKTTFSLAVGRWDPKTKEETTDWFNIEVWDKQAEFAGEFIKKGEALATVYASDEGKAVQAIELLRKAYITESKVTAGASEMTHNTGINKADKMIIKIIC